jgi:LysR family transcriptional regulator of abg operon
MQLRHLRALQAVLETGSIRGGARKMNLSQPSLSRSIRELEDELGAPLVQRSTRGVLPTEYGRALLARISVIDKELIRAKEEIDQLRGLKGGNVAVGLSAVASFLMVSEALTRFWRSHAMASVRIVDGVFDLTLTDLRAGRLDFAISPLPRGPLALDVEAEPLFENRLVAVVRKEHALRKAVHLADLQACTWLLVGSDSTGLIADNFTDLNLQPPHIGLASESFPALLEMIVGTDCVTILPEQLLNHRFVRDHIVALELNEHIHSTTMAIVKRSGVPLTPLAESLALEFRRLARRYA